MTKCVLNEQTIRFDVVCINLKASFDPIVFVLHSTADIVVSSPKERVVNDDTLNVDLNHFLDGDLLESAVSSAADARVNILNHARVRKIAILWFVAKLQKVLGRHGACFHDEA